MKSVYYNSQRQSANAFIYFFIHCFVERTCHGLFYRHKILFILMLRSDHTDGLVVHISTCKLKASVNVCIWARDFLFYFVCAFKSQAFTLQRKIPAMIFPICSVWHFGILALEYKSISFCLFFTEAVERTNPGHICHIKRFVQRWWMDVPVGIQHSRATLWKLTKKSIHNENLKAWVCERQTAYSSLNLLSTHTRTHTVRNTCKTRETRTGGGGKATIQSERVNLI